MRVQDIQAKAEERISFPIDINRAVDYINDGLIDMTAKYETAGIMTTTMADIKETNPIIDPTIENPTISGPSNTPLRLPVDCVKVEKIINQVTGAKVLGYEVEGLYITLPEEGIFKIFYMRVPKAVRVYSDELECHIAYQNALIYYVAAQEMHKLFGEENQDVFFLLSKYEKMGEDANNLILSGNKPKRRYIPAPRW